MLKIYVNIYRIGIIVIFGLYILLMVAASSGGYGDSNPGWEDMAGFAYMLSVFVSLTIFMRSKNNTTKSTARYIALVLVLVLLVGFSILLAFVELSPEILFIYVLFTIISGLLSYELIRYKSPG